MSIYYNLEKNLFKLDTNQSSYVMKVVKGGFLAHMYYGGKIDTDCIDYVLVNADRVFSGNPMEADGDRTFSLDTLPLEYPTFGIGDYRTSCFCVELENGSTATDLRYISHAIYHGKPKLEGLPATYGTEEEVDTLEIWMEDYYSKVRVKLSYSVFEKYNAITRSCIVLNPNQEPVKIKRVLSSCIDFNNSEYELIHLYGRWASERNIERKSLMQGKQVIESLRGASSSHHNPFVALVHPGADEKSGECYGFNFVYSGNFTCEVEVNQDFTTRIVMGLQSTDFSWKLEKDGTFVAPEVVMVYGENGLNDMSQNFHDLYRNNLCRGEWKYKRRPILINNWEATYFDFNEEKLLDVAKEAADLGIEMLVMDDGWFGEREDDTTSLGDWFVNESKLRGGLEKLVNKVNALGLKFGIWFEPEMISEKSKLYEIHPDWCIQVPGRNRTVSRSQFVLDMSRKDVEDYLFQCMDQIVSSANIAYIKWDMNRNMTEVYSAMLEPDRQREIWHRYILGVYSLLDRLIEKHPHILFEGCSGGGGRFDPGMLYYTPQIWCSDNTDALERVKIQYGTSLAYPIPSMVCHVSAIPNHQTERKTPLQTRGEVATAGILGYQLDLSKMLDHEKEEIKKQVTRYKELYNLISTGDFYRITNPFERVNAGAWCFISKDKREILFQHIQLKGIPNAPLEYVKISGVDQHKIYQDMESGSIYTGSVLKHIGLRIPSILEDGKSRTEDAKSFSCYLKEVQLVSH